MANAAKQATQQPARQAPEETAPKGKTEEVIDPNNPAAEEAIAATTESQPNAEGEAGAAAEANATNDAPEGAANEENAEVAATEAPEAEAETVHSQTISFTPEQQALLNKRIGKEVAKTKAIKEQMEAQATKLAEMEAKLGQATQQTSQSGQQPSPAPAPIVISANVPLADVNNIAALGQRQQAAKDAIRYVEEVLDDQKQWKTITDPNDSSREIEVHQVGTELHTRTTLKAALRNAKVTLEDHIPARNQFLMMREQATKQAHADFPFLTDKQSPEYQMVEAGRRNPHLAQLMAMPNSEWLLGIIVEGKKSLDARMAAAKKPATTTAVKPKVPASKPSPDQVAASASGSGERAPIGSAQRAALAQESKKLSEKGGINSEDAAKLLLRSSQQRNSR